MKTDSTPKFPVTVKSGAQEHAPPPEASTSKDISASFIIPAPQYVQTPDQKLIQQIEAAMPTLYHDYKKLVTPSEVPEEFHIFAFMTMISALAGDKVSFGEGTDTIYPNIWTMLVGESSISRKSTSFRTVLQILELTEKVNLLASKGSPEGLFSELVETKGVGMLHHGELGSLLGALGKKYMIGHAEELCEYYDPCPAGLIKRLSGRETKVDHLALSWIAATTPDSLNKCYASDHIASGFLPRWNIVFGGKPSSYHPFRPIVQIDLLKKFAEQIADLISDQPSQWKWGEKTTRLYEDWYNIHRPKVCGEAIGYFHIRIFEVVKKYAVLLAFANRRDTVEAEDMSLAIRFGEYFMTTAERLITKEISESKNERELQNIFNAMHQLKDRREELTRRNVMRKTHLDLWHFNKHIETLVARDLVKKIGTSEKEFELLE